MAGRLVAMLIEGGLEVVTPPFPSRSRDDRHRCQRIRTVVQPDGDLLVFITGDALNDPQLIQRHQRALTRTLAALVIDRQRLAGFLSRLGPLVLLATGIVSLGDLAYGWVIQQVYILVAGPLLALAIGLLPRLLGWLWGRKLRRRLREAGLLG
ncbi:MAG: hypothetical protein R3310_08160 [Candidatus Competibacteraceae bacterium]|nr:hypothetical protein [Candidatus Competibacteraceae bacterium]